MRVHGSQRPIEDRDFSPLSSEAYGLLRNKPQGERRGTVSTSFSAFPPLATCRVSSKPSIDDSALTSHVAHTVLRARDPERTTRDSVAATQQHTQVRTQGSVCAPPPPPLLACAGCGRADGELAKMTLRHSLFIVVLLAFTVLAPGTLHERPFAFRLPLPLSPRHAACSRTHSYVRLIDVESPYDKQILKDIARTFPEMPFFRDNEGKAFSLWATLLSTFQCDRACPLHSILSSPGATVVVA